jgi:tRNA(Ile)-lysidine synthase
MDARQIERRFVAFCRDRALMRDGQPVVVALSGGADSCALLALLCETGVVARDRLIAAYFDHRLRGEDASREERRAVGALCARHGIALETGEWPDPVASEAAARRARYAFLASVAQAHQAAAVATGHTSDDQVETVLMHTLRGAGLYGVAGMPPSSPWPFASQPGLRLVRPLLGLSRADTRAYCAARGIAFIDDASNDDVRFLRNRVRRELLPAMEAIDPGARRAVLRLAEEARESIGAITSVVGALVVGGADGNVQLSRVALRTLPDELVAHAYRSALVRLLGDARDFERRHYAILRRAHEVSTGSTFALPRGVVATVDPDAIVLSRGPLAAALIDPAIAHPLPFNRVLGAWRIEVAPAEGVGALRFPPEAVVRGRRPGDRIAPPGMRGHKKLQDYYVDRKVPRRDRDAAPVIAAGAEVLWTPFGGPAAPVAGAAYRVKGHLFSRAGPLNLRREDARVQPAEP